MAKAKKSSGGAGCGLLIVIAVLVMIIGGIANLVDPTNNTAPSMTDFPDPYAAVTGLPSIEPLPPSSSPAPDSATLDPATELPDSTDDGTGSDGGGSDDGGSVNLPGDGYVSGPGVNCGLSGCHVHVLPHFGFHF